MSIPQSFSSVNVKVAANVYFDGKVTSRTLEFPDGTTKTLGILLPGEYEFGTGLAEQMQLVSGAADVQLPGSEEWKHVPSGGEFFVPSDARFRIRVAGVTDYICSFLPA